MRATNQRQHRAIVWTAIVNSHVKSANRGGVGAPRVTAAWPLAARAQRGLPVLGMLSSGSAESFAPRVRAFRQGLSEIGYTSDLTCAGACPWKPVVVRLVCCEW